jgi:hypothetical protein
MAGMMASSTYTGLFCLLVLPWAAMGDTHGGKFLGSNRKMNTAFIRAELQGVLGEVLGNGHGVEHDRLSKIRSVLKPMFQALPKNDKGKLSAPVMRYTVRRYFSQQHAWIVKGFEPHADIVNVTEQDRDILQGKVPDYVRSVLEDQFRLEGFAFEDTVAMVAALERLAFDEVVKIAEQAFSLNSQPFTEQMNRTQLMEVLSSYLILEMLEGTDDKDQHVTDKQNIRERYPNWDTTYQFLVDVASSDIFGRRNIVNPFREAETFTFEDASRMAEQISEQFGPWSNHECHEMRDMLTKYDVHQTGRVKISEFYRSTVEGAWQFLEPTQFLRQNGALDESSKVLGPQVIIANYIAGMSNCITSAPYYSICCLNDCDQVFRHIEEVIQSSTASTSQIIQAVDGMPQGATISPELAANLDEISALHKDQIPIHGRLLAQWLHFAFPHECPYPHLGGLSPKTQEQWRAQVGEDAESVSEEEVRQHLEADSSRRPASQDAGKAMWVLHETLLESSTASDRTSSGLRVIAQFGVLGCFASLIVKKASSLMSPNTKSTEYDV